MLRKIPMLVACILAQLGGLTVNQAGNLVGAALAPSATRVPLPDRRLDMLNSAAASGSKVRSFLPATNKACAGCSECKRGFKSDSGDDCSSLCAACVDSVIVSAEKNVNMVVNGRTTETMVAPDDINDPVTVEFGYATKANFHGSGNFTWGAANTLPNDLLEGAASGAEVGRKLGTDKLNGDVFSVGADGDFVDVQLHGPVTVNGKVFYFLYR